MLASPRLYLGIFFQIDCPSAPVRKGKQWSKPFHALENLELAKNKWKNLPFCKSLYLGKKVKHSAKACANFFRLLKKNRSSFETKWRHSLWPGNAKMQLSIAKIKPQCKHAIIKCNAKTFKCVIDHQSLERNYF